MNYHVDERLCDSSFLRCLIDSLRAVIFYCDSSGLILDANEALQKYLKVKKEEICGMHIRDLVIPEDRRKFDLLFSGIQPQDSYSEINFYDPDDDIIMFCCYSIKIEQYTVIIARYNDPAYFRLQEELVKINNEVVNVYREIEKKNRQLEQLNKILEKQKNEIQIKNSIINNQLKIARRIQEKLIDVNNKTIYNLEFSIRYKPAYDIGGDYFNVIDVCDGKVGLFVCDMSGHGISAALVMVIMKMLFLNQNKNYENPDILMSELNKQFYALFGEGFEEIYCTAFYCVIDAKNMSIKYCNAGHPTPLICNNGGGANEVEGKNLPLGFFKDVEYCSNEVNLGSEDRFILYTDGMDDVILRCNISSVGSQQNDNEYDIFKMLKEKGFEHFNHQEELKDDATFIIVEVKKE